jgi:hypothetical protein
MTDDDTGKSIVTIDGNVCGELFAAFENDDTLVEALRRRASYIGASYNLIDQLTGLGEGSTTKYLSAARARALTIASAMRLCQALGVKAVLVTDAELTRKMQARGTKRDGSKARARRPPPLGQAQLKRVLRPAAAELGRRGHAAFIRATTPERRREIGRHGAAVRWGKAEVREQPSR